jgi:hypothetical protein
MSRIAISTAAFDKVSTTAADFPSGDSRIALNAPGPPAVAILFPSLDTTVTVWNRVPVVPVLRMPF